MAPQGIGAALVMRFSGSITDRYGPRRVVPGGILLMAAATVPFAFVTTSTSEVLLAGSLFMRGIGLGLSMMPIMAAAYFDLSNADIPRASTTLNIVRQIGGSVATALFAVILERQIIAQSSHGGHGTQLNSYTVKFPPAVADKVATAFGNTFWWAVATILLAFIPTLFLPSHAAKARADAGPMPRSTPGRTVPWKKDQRLACPRCDSLSEIPRSSGSLDAGFRSD